MQNTGNKMFYPASRPEPAKTMSMTSPVLKAQRTVTAGKTLSLPATVMRQKPQKSY